MRGNSLFWGAVLVLCGGILLLDNLGIIRVNFWGILWPIILIAFGAWILLGVASKGQTLQVENVSVPLENATSANVRVHHGAGRLAIDATSTADHLVSGTFAGGLTQTGSIKNGTFDLDLKPRSDSQAFWGFPWSWSNRNGFDWHLGLNKDIPISLRVETGAADVKADLSEMHISNLSVSTGASSVTLTLPAVSGFTQAKIEGGATSIDVCVPDGVAAQIHTQSGLSSVTIDQSRFPRHDGVYVSPDYLTAANKIDLDIQVGVGSVTVK